MTIRRAIPADEDAIVAVDSAVIGTEERRRQIRSAINDGLCVAAEIDGEVAAYAILSYHFFGNGFVELLMVHPTRQRHGLGMALLEHCRSICRTQKMFTSTNRSNTPMRALLERAEFIFCGEIDHLDEGDPERVYVKYLQR